MSLPSNSHPHNQTTSLGELPGSTLNVFPLGLLCRCRPFDIPDLLNEIILLIAELLVFRTVRLKVAQEVHQLGLILDEDVQDRLCLIGVGHKHLRGHKKPVKVTESAFIRSELQHNLVTDPDLFTFKKGGQNGQLSSVESNWSRQKKKKKSSAKFKYINLLEMLCI